MVESVDWADEGAMLTGTAQLRRPVPNDPSSLPIGRGHQLRCRVRYRDHVEWWELWRMRCSIPEVDYESGVVTVELTDDMNLLRGHIREWNFRKTKRRKNGWRAHAVAIDVCNTVGVRVGQLVQGTEWVTKIKGRMSALDVIRKAYEVEHKETKRRYIVRMHDGRLNVVQYRRNRILYSVGDIIVSALLRREGKAQPTTVITGKAKVGKGSDAKKIEHTEFRRAVVQRFGYVHREKSYGKLDSKADLIKAIRRDLAEELEIRKSAEGISFPGIPFIRRGDACELDIPREGYRDEQAIVFVSRVAHSVTAQGYTTEIDVIADDAYAEYREELEATLRKKRRRERKRRTDDEEDES
jgi:hypothetical protein